MPAQPPRGMTNHETPNDESIAEARMTKGRSHDRFSHLGPKARDSLAQSAGLGNARHNPGSTPRPNGARYPAAAIQRLRQRGCAAHLRYRGLSGRHRNGGQMLIHTQPSGQG